MSELLQYRKNHFFRNNQSLHFFRTQYSNIKTEDRDILEIGTKQWYGYPTHHKGELFPYSKYTMTDVQEGADVDVVSDAHSLSKTFPVEQFSTILSCSVFEHLHSPWVAAEEILKVLKPGGLFFIQVHQCFPIHGFPDFYFLFSDSALKHLFKGASKVVASYDYPATLTPDDSSIDWNKAAPVFLNANISGVK